MFCTHSSSANTVQYIAMQEAIIQACSAMYPTRIGGHRIKYLTQCDVNLFRRMYFYKMGCDVAKGNVLSQAVTHRG